jgi:hypothetical protein
MSLSWCEFFSFISVHNSGLYFMHAAHMLLQSSAQRGIDLGSLCGVDSFQRMGCISIFRIYVVR